MSTHKKKKIFKQVRGIYGLKGMPGENLFN